MIAYLNGRFLNKTPTTVHVDVHGVGYEVNISLNTYSQIQKLDGGKLYTHLQIKEDAHTIYGFFEPAEKEIFVMLISVSGVGASTARMMLSNLRPDEVSKAIAHGNAGLLEKVKGIGKKTAERIILELKDKMTKLSPIVTLNPNDNNTLQQDALNALMALGIGKPLAENSIKKVINFNPNINNLEELIKSALKAI